MKRVSFCLLFVTLLLCQFSFAGTVSLIARGGLYTAPGSSGTSSTMLGFGVEQEFMPHVTARLIAETTSYMVGTTSITFTPITADVIYSQTALFPGLPITAYGGAGVSYNTTTGGGSSTQTGGGELVAGLSTNLGGLLLAGVEGRYIVPNLSDTSVGASAVTAYVSGALGQTFHF